MELFYRCMKAGVWTAITSRIPYPARQCLIQHETYSSAWGMWERHKYTQVGVPVGVLFSEIRVKRVHTVTQRAKQYLGKTNTYNNNRWF